VPKTDTSPEWRAAVASRLSDAVVYFKWTCSACGERVAFDEPNCLFEEGDCQNCGHRQEVTEGGYELHIRPREVGG
jgi:DNA-directed RNA polymerase subunit RPC12/RpoP